MSKEGNTGSRREHNGSDLQGCAGGRGTGHGQTQPSHKVGAARLQKRDRAALKVPDMGTGLIPNHTPAPCSVCKAPPVTGDKL